MPRLRMKCCRFAAMTSLMGRAVLWAMPGLFRLGIAMGCLKSKQYFATLRGMDTSLDTRVKALLEARRGEWQAVADGSGISYSWLSKFSNGHIDNPGYATLKKLLAYLDPQAADEPAKAA